MDRPPPLLCPISRRLTQAMLLNALLAEMEARALKGVPSAIREATIGGSENLQT